MPPLASSKSPILSRSALGERAFHVAKELALEQRFRNGAAVDGDESLVGPGAALVHEPGDELLAGAALAGDEHGGRVTCDLARHVERRLDRGAVADDRVGAANGAELVLQLLYLRAQLLALRRFAHGEHDLFGPERLLHVVVGAFLHRCDGRVGIAVRAHGDDERVTATARVAFDEFEAVHLRHAEIAEHEIDVVRRELAERLFAFARGVHRVPFCAQNPRNRLTKSRLVVNDENLHGRIAATPAGRSSEPADSSGTGKYIMNAAPPSRAGRTQIVPPSPSTMRETTARPSPVPRPGSLVV